MNDNGNKSQAPRRLRAILIGAVVGLLLAVGASFFATSDDSPPGYVEIVDRWGMPRIMTVYKWPPYVVLPVVGAIVCFAWSEVRHVFWRR
jgi:hypothetical protein